MLLLVAIFLAHPPAHSAQQQAPTVAANEPPIARTKLRSFVTQHQGVFNGLRVQYTASVVETILPDPSGRPAASLVSTVLNQYMRNELAVDIDEKYETIVRLRWNNNQPPPGMRIGVYENVAPYLGAAMRQNSDMRAFVSNGYYDMLTPLFSAEHTVTHACMPLERVRFGYYHAGHMPYLGESNLKQLCSDLRAFITAKK